MINSDSPFCQLKQDVHQLTTSQKSVHLFSTRISPCHHHLVDFLVWSPSRTSYTVYTKQCMYKIWRRKLKLRQNFGELIIIKSCCHFETESVKVRRWTFWTPSFYGDNSHFILPFPGKFWQNNAHTLKFWQVISCKNMKGECQSFLKALNWMFLYPSATHFMPSTGLNMHKC